VARSLKDDNLVRISSVFLGVEFLNLKSLEGSLPSEHTFPRARPTARGGARALKTAMKTTSPTCRTTPQPRAPHDFLTERQRNGAGRHKWKWQMPALFFLHGQNLKAVCSGAAVPRTCALETKYNASARAALRNSSNRSGPRTEKSATTRRKRVSSRAKLPLPASAPPYLGVLQPLTHHRRAHRG
jgi:hypothetical protein